MDRLRVLLLISVFVLTTYHVSGQREKSHTRSLFELFHKATGKTRQATKPQNVQAHPYYYPIRGYPLWPGSQYDPPKILPWPTKPDYPSDDATMPGNPGMSYPVYPGYPAYPGYPPYPQYPGTDDPSYPGSNPVDEGDGIDGEDGEDGEDGPDGPDGGDGGEDGEGEDGEGEEGEDGGYGEGEDGEGEDGEGEDGEGEDGEGEDGEDGEGGYDPEDPEEGEDPEDGEGEDPEDGEGEDPEDGYGGDGGDGGDDGGDGGDGGDGDGGDGDGGDGGDGGNGGCPDIPKLTSFLENLIPPLLWPVLESAIDLVETTKKRQLTGIETSKPISPMLASVVALNPKMGFMLRELRQSSLGFSRSPLKSLQGGGGYPSPVPFPPFPYPQVCIPYPPPNCDKRLPVKRKQPIKTKNPKKTNKNKNKKKKNTNKNTKVTTGHKNTKGNKNTMANKIPKNPMTIKNPMVSKNPLAIKNPTSNKTSTANKNKNKNTKKTKKNKTNKKTNKKTTNKNKTNKNKKKPTRKSRLRLTRSNSTYWESRKNIARSGINYSYNLGSSLLMTRQENLINKVFNQLVTNELASTLNGSRPYGLSEDFRSAKRYIESSPIFHFIKNMPKGANLHASVLGLIPQSYLYNTTYSRDLYFCFDSENEIKYRFGRAAPDQSCKWYLLSEVRKDLGMNPEVLNTFNLGIQNAFDLLETNTTCNIISQWKRHRAILKMISPLVNYKPVFIKSFQLILQGFLDDNILYAELTTDFPEVYDLDGTKYNKLQVAQLFSDVLQEFKKSNPDFIGVKFVYQPLSTSVKELLDQEKATIESLFKSQPHLVAGMNLVGSNDSYSSLVESASEFLKYPSYVNFYYDSAIKNPLGPSVTRDILDAILLHSKRLSNVLAIAKEPNLINVFRQDKSALDVSPLYHKVIGYVTDLRNHPQAPLFSDAFPMVLTSGDSALWGVSGLSYDWYAALVSYKPETTNLASLKKLAVNSILYSSLSEEEQALAYSVFETQWNNFVNNFEAQMN